MNGPPGRHVQTITYRCIFQKSVSVLFSSILPTSTMCYRRASRQGVGHGYVGEGICHDGLEVERQGQKVLVAGYQKDKRADIFTV
jgi:hypothetical protein